MALMRLTPPLSFTPSSAGDQQRCNHTTLTIVLLALSGCQGDALHVMLSLRHSSHEVIVANKQLDGTDMMSELLGKRQPLTD
jgi:hypothetical protein